MTHTPDTDDDGRAVIRVTRESEFDQEQYELLAALEEYEAGLGHHGLPLEETMSPDADPGNPDGKYLYLTRVRRDWYDDAVENEEKDPKWGGDNYSRARKFSAYRVER